MTEIKLITTQDLVALKSVYDQQSYYLYNLCQQQDDTSVFGVQLPSSAIVNCTVKHLLRIVTGRSPWDYMKPVLS